MPGWIRSRVRGLQTEITQLSSSLYGWDVYRYLKGLGQQLMIWKCRNAIQTFWHHEPLPYIDLYCDVIGTMKTVAWSYRGRKIAGTGVELSATDVSRYSYTIATHYDAGQYYSAWLDFRLRIHNATQLDSGIYRFRVTSPTGDADQRLVYVDISAPPHPRVTTPTTTPTSGVDVAAAENPEVVPTKSMRRRKQSSEQGVARRRRLRKQRRRRRRKRLERRLKRRGSASSTEELSKLSEEQSAWV